MATSASDAAISIESSPSPSGAAIPIESSPSPSDVFSPSRRSDARPLATSAATSSIDSTHRENDDASNTASSMRVGPFARRVRSSALTRRLADASKPRRAAFAASSSATTSPRSSRTDEGRVTGANAARRFPRAAPYQDSRLDVCVRRARRSFARVASSSSSSRSSRVANARRNIGEIPRTPSRRTPPACTPRAPSDAPTRAQSTPRSSAHPGFANFALTYFASTPAETSRSGSKNFRVCATSTSARVTNASASKSCSFRKVCDVPAACADRAPEPHEAVANSASASRRSASRRARRTSTAASARARCLLRNRPVSARAASPSTMSSLVAFWKRRSSATHSRKSAVSARGSKASRWEGSDASDGAEGSDASRVVVSEDVVASCAPESSNRRETRASVVEGVRGFEAGGWDAEVPTDAWTFVSGDAVGPVAAREASFPVEEMLRGSRRRREASPTRRSRRSDGGRCSGSRMPFTRVSRRRIAPARSISSTGNSSSSGDHCDGGEGEGRIGASSGGGSAETGDGESLREIPGGFRRARETRAAQAEASLGVPSGVCASWSTPRPPT